MSGDIKNPGAVPPNHDAVHAFSATVSAALNTLRQELNQLPLIDNSADTVVVPSNSSSPETCGVNPMFEAAGKGPDMFSGSLWGRRTLQTLVIGGAVLPRRDMVIWNTQSIEASGWVPRFRLQVFTQDPEISNLKTLRIFVGESFMKIHRVQVSLNREETSNKDWSQKLSFYAFDTPPSTARKDFVMIAVGEVREIDPRCKFELGRHVGVGLEDVGWVEKFVFWLPSWCLLT